MASRSLCTGWKVEANIIVPGRDMKYIKVILTIIAILLALNIVKSMIPSATATSVQDVNISSVYGLRLNPLRVEIVD